MSLQSDKLHNVKVCWMGGSRYTNPLNATQAAKWSAMAALDAALYVIGFSADAKPRRFTQTAHFYLLPRLPLPPLRYLMMLFGGGCLALWLVLRHGVGIIVTQSPYEGAVAALVKLTARLFGRRVSLVVENHGDFEKVLFQQRQVSFAGAYRWLMGVAARFAFRHADALRAISSATRAQLERWSPGKPIEQFITWTDDRVFRETQREIPLAEAQDVLYVGVLTRLKGVHFLVDAFTQIAKEYPTARLLLVGKGEQPEYERELREAVNASGVGERITFLGAQPQTELARLMGRARVLVLPSTSEGLGRVLVEAMLCGTPVIGSRVGGIPDVVQDGQNGFLIPPGDVDALATALRRVYDDAAIQRMGECALAVANQLFSQEGYVEGYRRLLKSALDPSAPPAYREAESRQVIEHE